MLGVGGWVFLDLGNKAYTQKKSEMEDFQTSLQSLLSKVGGNYVSGTTDIRVYACTLE
jgi:hypothetical protein